MTPYLLDTNIFNKLLKKKEFLRNFEESIQKCNFPDLNSLYFTPFCVLEYLGLKSKHPPIIPKNFPEHRINEEIEQIISDAYQFYIKQECFSPKSIKSRVENIEKYVIEDAKKYYNRFKEYIHFEFQISNLAYHLTADFINNYPFPIERRKDVFIRLSMDILRNIYVPYDVSKFRLAQNDWDGQWVRLKKESSGKLERLDKSIRMKSKGDFLDSDIIHLSTLGVYSKNKTYPLVVVTTDELEDVLGRITLYKGLVKYLKNFLTTKDGLENYPLITHSEGIIFFANLEGIFIGKSNVSEIPTITKEYNQ
ncbi:hypothetical protein JWG41_13915 [Leptospira sp. 201903075]|uniref:hypothetical protein n=1 Tax=Leptospira chreensis TaxID=2810035 RepID=UPI00196504AF|nr:hypothetical protein [Leptospira chreensis]MBM9591549.1 hypothetical protein [Leptospira chreensis]